MKKYPFKILDSYTQSDADIYFGRDEEQKELYGMVFQTNILLVYGPVGTGKTSLIQCGLAQKFDSYDWSCMFIRRNNNLNKSFLQAVKEQVEKTLNEVEWEEQKIENGPMGLSPLFKLLYLSTFKPIYLIFDQFEELFILGDKTEEDEFIDLVRQTLEVEEPVKMIFCLREEYLGHLANFERKIPEIFKKKIRVEPMGFLQVEKVLKSATSLPNSSIKLKEGEEDAICNSIFSVIKGNDKVIRIQLPYLQVYLRKLYTALLKPGEETTTLTLQAIKDQGDLGDVLSDFVESQVRILVNEKLTESDIWMILSQFATLEGTKEPISMKTLYEKVPKIPNDVLDSTIQTFEKNKILRYIEERRLYEFVHDSIAQKVAEKRDRDEVSFLKVKQLIKNQLSSFNTIPVYFDEHQLNFIDGHIELLNSRNSLLEKERDLIADSREKVNSAKKEIEKKQSEELRKVRRNLNYVVIGSAVVLMFLLTTCYYYVSFRNAEDNRILQTRIHAASALKESGDEFSRLGKLNDACDSYTRALDTLKGTPGDLLYDELVKRKKICE